MVPINLVQECFHFFARRFAVVQIEPVPCAGNCNHPRVGVDGQRLFGHADGYNLVVRAVNQQHGLVERRDFRPRVKFQHNLVVASADGHLHEVELLRNFAGVGIPAARIVRHHQPRIEQHRAAHGFGIPRRIQRRHQPALAFARDHKAAGIHLIQLGKERNDSIEVIEFGQQGHVRRCTGALALRAAAAEVERIADVPALGEIFRVAVHVAVRAVEAVAKDDRGGILRAVRHIQPARNDAFVFLFNRELFDMIGVFRKRRAAQQEQHQEDSSKFLHNNSPLS